MENGRFSKKNTKKREKVTDTLAYVRKKQYFCSRF